MLKSLIVMSMLLVAALPAMAQPPWHGDVFADKQWNIENRPPVPSDIEMRQDMFPQLPPYWRSDADMFQRVRMRTYEREDMFRHRTLRPAPDMPLFRGYPDR